MGEFGLVAVGVGVGVWTGELGLAAVGVEVLGSDVTVGAGKGESQGGDVGVRVSSIGGHPVSGGLGPEVD
jgi:hypothetical protein